MLFANVNRKARVLNSALTIKNDQLENQIELNPQISLAKSRKASKKFKNIYTQLSGKQIVVQSNKENHSENKFFEKFLMTEILNAYYSFFSILSAVSYYEFSYGQSDKDMKNYSIYLYACTIFSVCLWINIILGELIKLKYDKEKRVISKQESMYSSGRLKFVLIKLLLFFLHPNPICADITYNSYNKQVNMNVTRKINSIFCIFVLLRCYFIFRYFIYMSSYIYPESNRICRKYFFEADTEYAIKSLVQNNPIGTYSVSLVIFLLSFSFSIRVFERDIQKEFEIFWNSIYYTLITMATVGYGDIVAKTNEGRTIAMIACIVGVFLISMMIISVNKILTMSSTELNALLILERVYSNKDLEDSAKKVILQFSKILKSEHSLKNTVEKETTLFRYLRSSLKEFNEVYNANKSFGETTFNTIYNTISVVSHDQEEYCEKDKEYSLELKKLKSELEEVYALMTKNHKSANTSTIS
jgi:potassium intermediate/small conductance calcium-activated channel subfamily N protein 2